VAHRIFKIRNEKVQIPPSDSWVETSEIRSIPNYQSSLTLVVERNAMFWEVKANNHLHSGKLEAIELKVLDVTSLF